MFSKDFKEFIQLLAENQIEYMVVGGYAVTIHGYPRYTGDIDIWINPLSENIAKIPEVLIQFGFSESDLKGFSFKKKDDMIRIGNPPYRIDIMIDVDGVDFKECYHRRTKKIIDGIEINFIGYSDLIKNKKASGRKKDQIDIENLESQ